MKLQLTLLILVFGYAAATLTYEEQLQRYQQYQRQQYLQQQQRQKEQWQQQQAAQQQKQQYAEETTTVTPQNSWSKYGVVRGHSGIEERFGGSAPDTVIPQSSVQAQTLPQPQPQPQEVIDSRLGSALPPINLHSPSENPHERFNTELFQRIAPVNTYKNVVYSPISLQTLMALISLGAKGQTAEELFQGLQLPRNRNAIATTFDHLVNADKLSIGPHLVMANKIYYSNKISLKDLFNRVARKSFDSEFESIDFGDPVSSAYKMNGWVESKTNSRIQRVITPQAIDTRTHVLLINAIYFKAKWAKEFSVKDTLNDFFFVTPNQKLQVDMMYTDDKFRYGHFANLKAGIIELPYMNSDLSMMIILPDEVDGLARLESELNNIDLSNLAASLSEEQVVLRLPRFRIQFEMDMIETLKNLNIQTVFSTKADLSEMFTNVSDKPVGISKVQHKAYIDVNEAGSEAAGASFANIIPLSLTKTVTMSVNHPFIFAIRSPKVVYFVGHVVSPTTV